MIDDYSAEVDGDDDDASPSVAATAAAAGPDAGTRLT